MKAIKIYLRPKGLISSVLKSKKFTNKDARYSGVVLIVSMLIMAIITVWSVSLFAISNTNTQVAYNHKRIDNALSAAQSGLETARYIIAQVSEDLKNNAAYRTSSNTVSDAEANIIWGAFGDKIVAMSISGADVTRSSELITVSSVNFANGEEFTLKFSRIGLRTIMVQSIGNDGDDISRTITMKFSIAKESEVLKYAIASRGRIWITGDSTIHGSIYSSYGKKTNGALLPMSPFNMTDDSRVEGTINTILTQEEIDTRSYQLETLGANGKPMFEFGLSVFDGDGNPVSGTYGPVDDYGFLLDTSLNPVYDENGYRIVRNFEYRYFGNNDEVNGYHENINYGQPDQSNMAGMSINDYDTSSYRNAIPSKTVSATPSTISNGVLSTSKVSTVTEYFPHASLAKGGYTKAASSGSKKLTRYKYENKTLRNIRVSNNTNALFKNCVFEDVLYVECAQSTSSYYNNIRFENCTFNGVIVTETPNALKWQDNALYFTGSAEFENTSSVKEATILAPHFNVDLGNTNPVGSGENVLTGAIIGGIVDVRGNASIKGTIISMCDTSQWTSGYVANIGATLEDGGSETTEEGDIGIIEIEPDPDKSLPSGIKTPIIIKPVRNSYNELI